MSHFISRIPFFKLLMPIVVGILANDYLPPIPYTTVIAIVGIVFMILSFFVKERQRFDFRWLFGVGLNIFLFGLISIIYLAQDENTAYRFSEKESNYIGYVLDIPMEKPRSIACNIQLSYPENKKIIAYLQKDDVAQALSPGDEIIFKARVQPFRNLGNPDDFDYERRMKIKGYTASAYLPSDNWKLTGKQIFTLSVLSQKVREKAVRFYRSFELDDGSYAFISALTLGYKNMLTDDMQQSFRVSGTAHVLAVSGLHVGIVFLIFSGLFAFLGKTGKKYQLRQWLIILALWFYAFITGMSPSVLRAVIMLSIVCIGLIRGRKGFTYNTVAIAAFAILIFNPYSLFDVSFQMSFTAVLSILFFQPKLSGLFLINNKLGRYAWDLFTVSLAAQLGVFPLVLFYFGTFPTYFFIANMFIVPLIGLIIYTTIPLIIFSLLKFYVWIGFAPVFSFFRWVLKSLISIVLGVAKIVESFPFSQISDKYITATQVFLTMGFMIAFTLLLTKKQAKYALLALSIALALILTNTFELTQKQPPQLVVYNQSGVSEIGLYFHAKRQFIEIPTNGVIPHPSQRIVRLSENSFQTTADAETFDVDILILSIDKSFSIEQLNKLFRPKLVVIDSSISRFYKNKISRECEKLGIRWHDVSQMGAFVINYS